MNRLLSRPMAVPIAICLALGAVSLLLPSEPSYDPWAWMVWGRELTLLQLDTNGGPSFKPLPLLLTPLWLRYMAHGNEAPMAIFFLLWGIERHLDGKRNHALILGFLACLLRPEVAPFIGAYGAYLFWKVPELRKLAVGLAIALPVLWLVPEWIGSGNPLGAGQKATGEPPWSLSLRDKPWLAALERAHSLLGLALEIGVVAAVALAIRAREKPILWL